MDELKLLDNKINYIDTKIMTILKDINQRLNILEDNIRNMNERQNNIINEITPEQRDNYI